MEIGRDEGNYLYLDGIVDVDDYMSTLFVECNSCWQYAKSLSHCYSESCENIAWLFAVIAFVASSVSVQNAS